MSATRQEQECADCGGDGYTDPRQSCPSCGHQARVARTCRTCGGSGKAATAPEHRTDLTGQEQAWPDNCTCQDDQALLRDGHRPDCPYLDGPGRTRASTEQDVMSTSGHPLLDEAVGRIQRAVRHLDDLLDPTTENYPTSESVRFALQAIRTGLVGSDAEFDAPDVERSREDNDMLRWMRDE